MFNKQATTGTEGQYGFNTSGDDCRSHFAKKFGGRFGGPFNGKAPWMNGFNGPFGNRKAANIEETDTTFIVSLYAAGLNKSDFRISATGDVLTISYVVPETTEGSKTNYVHTEYQPSSFERKFQLNNKVLTDGISASYTDGVLKVTLPKNPETNKPGQEVKVD